MGLCTYVLLQGLPMIGYVVAGIKHKSMCCCMDDPWDYVLLQAFFMGLCVVGIIHGIVYCCRDYAWSMCCCQAGCCMDYIQDYVL